MEIIQVMLKFSQKYEGKLFQEDDIDVVYDEPPTPLLAFEVEKVIEVFKQFTLSCNEGDDL